MPKPHEILQKPEICLRDQIVEIRLETKDCEPQLHNEMVYS